MQGCLPVMRWLTWATGRHVMMSTNDVVAHNGVKLNSVIDDQMRTFLFSQIDTTYYYRTFLAHNKIENEVWICYPKTGGY